jgi:hypothetical protein
MFPIKNGLKQRDAVSIAFQLCTGEFRKNQVSLKLKGTHHVLDYADDVNILGAGINTINKKQSMSF